MTGVFAHGGCCSGMLVGRGVEVIPSIFLEPRLPKLNGPTSINLAGMCR